MQLTIGLTKKFDLEQFKSQFVVPRLDVYFCDSLAETYLPILYSGNEIYDRNNPSVQPEGIYYRIMSNLTQAEYCIQYFVYWLDQNCTRFIGISNHKYDYEPIYVYLKPSHNMPIGIVNSGQSKVLGLSKCRFHKTEVRGNNYNARDQVEVPWVFKTSKAPFYPFGGTDGVTGSNCIKRYPLAGSIYFSEERPLFGLATCFHAFSGAENLLKGEQIEVPLKRFDDEVLTDWYENHSKNSDEEPFGHDVSNPFEFPHIKYTNPRH